MQQRLHEILCNNWGTVHALSDIQISLSFRTLQFFAECNAYVVQVVSQEKWNGSCTIEFMKSCHKNQWMPGKLKCYCWFER